MPNEQKKAEYMTAEFGLLAAKVSGPILYYTGREFPLTTSQWKQQCSYSPCVADPGHSKPGHVSGTNYDVSGAGLFEWLDGNVVRKPSYRNFATLHGRESLNSEAAEIVRVNNCPTSEQSFIGGYDYCKLRRNFTGRF